MASQIYNFTTYQKVQSFHIVWVGWPSNLDTDMFVVGFVPQLPINIAFLFVFLKETKESVVLTEGVLGLKGVRYVRTWPLDCPLFITFFIVSLTKKWRVSIEQHNKSYLYYFNEIIVNRYKCVMLTKYKS